ncbi:hypothetical protein niasHS_003114 [Heterodera schachtii]|uniref:Uncharacterized protein n=1 Tax=Heterodera schachtii TaxID=97005 RepID=A0ABD2K9Q3_HETSC
MSLVSRGQLKEEKRTLDEIYKAALKEGGKFILYAGGDFPGDIDGIKGAFEARFPGITMDVIVDYSKFHGPRIDIQMLFSSRLSMIFVLMQYKPKGWSAIYEDYRDPDGYFTGIMIVVFSNKINTRLVPNESDWPRNATDLLKPIFANGTIIQTYPNDDDAVLFWVKQVVDKYGWDYMTKLAAQKPVMVRGTGVDMSTSYATLTSMGPAVLSNSSSNLMILPDKDPFVIWAQQAAIFKAAKHPETAKLYLNFMLDKVTQQILQWSVRKDVPAKDGFKQSWEYKQSSHKALEKFMEDHEGVERFKTQMSFFFGEVQGDPSPGHVNLHQEKALLPH